MITQRINATNIYLNPADTMAQLQSAEEEVASIREVAAGLGMWEVTERNALLKGAFNAQLYADDLKQELYNQDALRRLLPFLTAANLTWERFSRSRGRVGCDGRLVAISENGERLTFLLGVQTPGVAARKPGAYIAAEGIGVAVGIMTVHDNPNAVAETEHDAVRLWCKTVLGREDVEIV